MKSLPNCLTKEFFDNHMQFLTDLPDLILSPLYSITPEIEASAAQKPTFSWWLHALLSGVISQAT